MYDVLVLLATYNGEKYLKEQLDSIFNQVGVNVKVLVRDDGSTDSTISILEEYHNKYNLEYIKGNNVGAFQNFMKLIELADEYEYYAYSDQDDIWLKEKLIQAMNNIYKSSNIPSLYFSKSTAVDNNLNQLTDCNHANYEDADSFAMASIRNICQGSTCVFNNELMKLLKKTPLDYQVEHDWWTFLVCLSVGGRVYADNNSYMLYRQHENNVLGAGSSFSSRLKRRGKLLISKRTHGRQKMCEIILNTYNDRLTNEARSVLTEIVNYRRSILNMFNLLFDKRFYRGEFQYSVSFFTAVLTRII